MRPPTFNSLDPCLQSEDMGIFDIFYRKSPAEQLRENKRLIDRAIRELERERVKLENQEKMAIIEMKKMAKLGQKVFFTLIAL